MKATLVRAFVLMIAVSGIAASAVASAKSPKALFDSKNVVPVPMCPLSDPSCCGLQ